jgi:radical SAM superfamily enzyme
VPIWAEIQKVKVGFSMKSLRTVQRQRWMMRQKSRLAKLLQIPVAVSMSCPFCRTKVVEGGFFCCSELEQAWAMTEKKSDSEAVVAEHNLAENPSWQLL